MAMPKLTVEQKQIKELTTMVARLAKHNQLLRNRVRDALSASKETAMVRDAEALIESIEGPKRV